MEGRRILDLRAVILTLSVMAVLEVVARSNSLLERAPPTMMGVFAAIEREIIAPASAPEIVIVGSSRMRDAADPRAIEKQLGLVKGSVLNLALGAGEPFTFLMFYQRHRERFRHARLLVVDVDEWFWNDELPPDEVERYFGTVEDRWYWCSRLGRYDELLGTVWRSYEVPDLLFGWAQSWVSGVHSPPIVNGRATWRTSAEISDTGPEMIDADREVRKLLLPYRRGMRYERELRKLLSLARHDGVKVVLMHIPVRDQFVNAEERMVPGVLETMRERVAVLQREYGVDVLMFERGTDIGIPDDLFYDYGHLAGEGTRRMLPIWASALRPYIAEPGSGADR